MSTSSTGNQSSAAGHGVRFLPPPFTTTFCSTTTTPTSCSATTAVFNPLLQVPRLQNQVSNEFKVGSINIGCKAGTDTALFAIMLMLQQFQPQVHVWYLTECDALAVQRHVEVPGWVCFRKWPGPGSRAACWLLRPHIVAKLRWRRWYGRSSALLLDFAQPNSPPSQSSKVFVVATHVAHGEDYPQSLLDLTRLLRCSPRTAIRCCIGDWNVNQRIHSATIAQCSTISWGDQQSRRRLLEQWQAANRLEVVLPFFSLGAAPAPWGAVSLEEPISRVPRGQETSAPSLLDYAYTDVSHNANSVLDWRCAVDDHAACVLSVQCHHVLKPKKTSTWQPKNEEQVLSF